LVTGSLLNAGSRVAHATLAVPGSTGVAHVTV
jgi:hypothetical protein